MKCQNLFSGKNKKTISKCRLLKLLPRVQSIQTPVALNYNANCMRVSRLKMTV